LKTVKQQHGWAGKFFRSSTTVRNVVHAEEESVGGCDLHSLSLVHVLVNSWRLKPLSNLLLETNVLPSVLALKLSDKNA
jgi:hypothetical protein